MLDLSRGKAAKGTTFNVSQLTCSPGLTGSRMLTVTQDSVPTHKDMDVG